MRWVPGHAGVLGNEAADAEAKIAATEAATGNIQGGPASLAYTKRRAKEHAFQAFQKEWLSAAPKRYKDLGIGVVKRPPELKLPRFALGKLYACRTGHGDFEAYHERLGHVDAELQCCCGRPKAPEHFLYCRLGKRAAPRTQWGPNGLQRALSTPDGAKRFANWLEKTGFYRRICPMHPAPQPEAQQDRHTPSII